MNFDFFRQFHKKIDFLGKFEKNFDFFWQISDKFRLLRQIHKKIDFPGQNWLFTAIYGQIILFLFKRHHALSNILLVHNKM